MLLQSPQGSTSVFSLNTTRVTLSGLACLTVLLNSKMSFALAGFFYCFKCNAAGHPERGLKTTGSVPSGKILKDRQIQG